jgi:DNA mismatch endonuclease (patch repair protein)
LKPLNESVAARMRQQKNTGTKPEMLLVDALRRRGFRVETHVVDLPGTPDIVLPARGVAVFVHGCFWHGCPWHYTEPRNNRKWWREKIARNKARDRRKAAMLRRRGWRVMIVWEHVEPNVAAERVQRFVHGGRAPHG